MQTDEEKTSSPCHKESREQLAPELAAAGPEGPVGSPPPVEDREYLI